MNIFEQLEKISSSKQQKINCKFYKTEEGEYAHGIKFAGIKQPTLRKIAEGNTDITPLKLKTLLASKFNEYRMCGFLIIMYKYETGNVKLKNHTYSFLIRNIKYLNNWDLIDSVVPNIIGEYIKNNKKEQEKILKFAKSKNMWRRRIALLSCFPLIKTKKFILPLKIAKNLINDKEDLINKATGWVLREIYKQDVDIAKKFIKKYYFSINRTTLNYAIEKMNEIERQKYLKNEF